MKLSKNNAVELLVESVNCIIIHYALSNMSCCYRYIRFGFCCLPPKSG